MIILFIALFLFINVAPLAADTEIKPLYQLPEKTTGYNDALLDTDSTASNFIVGSDDGLFRVTTRNRALPLWTDGRVDQILLLNLPDDNGIFKPTWVFRTTKGIISSTDLTTFTERNQGLPFLTVKKYKNNQVYLEQQIQELKDICANPLNNQELVTATKDNVYLSRDGGRSWKNIGSMSKSTAGIKAVAVATMQGKTVVFMSHPIFGFSYIFPDAAKAEWNDVDAGFEKMTSLSSPDEISDILPVVRTAVDGSFYTEIYASQMYMPRIYRFNWAEKKAELIHKGKEPTDSYDGLSIIDNVLLYTRLEGFGSTDIESYTSPGTPAQEENWHKAFAAVPGMTNTAWIPQSRSGFSHGLLLNELWMLYPGTINTDYAKKANNKKSIYASAYKCRTQEGSESFLKMIKDRNMNSIVIDMKDDYGLLRYDSKDPMILEKGQVSQYALDLDQFINKFKKEDIYLIARIVTFKDRTLSRYAGGKYAVWDAATNKPWVGIRNYEEVKDDAGNVKKEAQYYDENWVDPYSEEVWEYNVQIAKELIARGFDEIQFDYIRFPTDGLNLRNTQYRWRNKGMDKESALISFLSYARENIDAPIGIDIYGANGWYRSGTRTGQDAEMLAEYVDVIGPMFYPSHFEQSFLNYAPVADRTYRIYYYGTYRNTIMVRNRAIIRPWIQSFYLNVSYDRQYYDSEYIRKEFYGVKDATDRGYMCWNNSGDYSVTPPDNTANEKFTGTAPEASIEFKKPAIGDKLKPLPSESDVSVLDSILRQYEDLPDPFENKNSFIPFLQVGQ